MSYQLAHWIYSSGSIPEQKTNEQFPDNLADILSSVAVIGGVLVAHFGYPRFDGVGGLVIAFLILWNAIQIAQLSQAK